MTYPIIIRRGVVADAATLSHLASRTFYDTFYDTCTEEDMQGFLDQYYNTDQLERELSNPEDHYYIASINGAPVGYLRFGANPVPFAYDRQLMALELNRLYVDEQYHGQGVAKTLMQFFEDYATSNDYRLLWLGVWEHNERAKAFYKKWGFGATGEKHPFPIGNTPQTDEWWVKIIPVFHKEAAPAS